MEQLITEPVKTEPKVVSADEFITGVKLKTEVVLIPEFGPGKCVRVQGIALEVREKVRAASKQLDGTINEDQFQAFSVLFGLVEPKLDLKQVVAIRTGDPRVMDRIAKVIWRMSNMDAEGKDLKNG